jgi:hypothetical protein
MEKESMEFFSLKTSPTSVEIETGSEEEFITEHYWGYTKIKKSTSEYQVEHPTWEAYKVNSYSINVDF